MLEKKQAIAMEHPPVCNAAADIHFNEHQHHESVSSCPPLS